jgi:hypothetical protein
MTPNKILRAIASNWWVKVLGQNALGLIPEPWGSKANLTMARLLQGKIEERPTASAYRIARSVRNLALAREYANFRTEGAHVLELGTGWRGGDLALLVVFGARKITTFDHRQWLQADAFRHSVRLIENSFAFIEQEAKMHCADPTANLSRLLDACRSDSSLDVILADIGVERHIRPNASPIDVPLTRGDVDLFYTESVLQRLPLEAVGPIMDYVLRELLRDGGAVFHRTDQRDIHTLDHIGNKRWALEYLKYPDVIFRHFLSGKFTSQNRLRESDWLEMLKDNGIAIGYIESRIVKGDLEITKSFKPARRFRNKSIVDLATRCSLIVGQKTLNPRAPTKHVQRIGTVQEVES